MQKTISNLVKRLQNSTFSDTNVIPWSSPVPSFGDWSKSKVATVGLNPSNREFIDLSGKELDGEYRRLHTLRSLGLKRWSDADTEHINLIVDSCRHYFTRNPYDGWFKKLDYIISGTKASYYNTSSHACHLDLIPYATACKWTFLTKRQRTTLLTNAGDTLGMLLADSPIRLLILNGKSVIEHFEEITGMHLKKERMKNWSLPRKSKSHVMGFAYKGLVRDFPGIRLEKGVCVLGFNHNIQSSFGVTRQVVDSIQDWIASEAVEMAQ
jgi:hypothetical protein